MSLRTRIERILDFYGFAFKGILIIAWLLWAMQLTVPLKEMGKDIAKELREQRNVDVQAERVKQMELRQMVDQMIVQAKKEGSSYGPKRYFEDLRILEEKEYKYRVKYSLSDVLILQKISTDNRSKGHFTDKDISRESDRYLEWRRVAFSDQEEFDKIVRSLTWRDVFSWFEFLYLRSLLLVLFYYLIRMTERRGVVETILAEKLRFVLAIFLWPVYFTKYPFNVIREIRVEAELRRIKGLFEALTAKESQLVQAIANGSGYRDWLAAYHQQNQRRFKRGLILALAGTVVFHIFLLPASAKSREGGSKDPISVVCSNVVGIQQGRVLVVDDGSQNDHQNNNPGLAPETDFTEPQAWIGNIEFLGLCCKGRKVEPLDRVPLSLLFG